MLSCTEFIPAYSELFKFIEEREGYKGVEDYWIFISDEYVDGFLGPVVTEKGLEGCYDYWSHSLNEEAADFTMTDREGNTLTLHGFIENGKPIVLNFWASWCPPCRIEMPDFEKVYAELGNEVQFIMLNLVDGTRETKESGVKFIDEQGYTFPIFFDYNRSGASAYAVRSIPTTIFIDKDGYITNTMIGAIDEETLRNGVNSLTD